ncbi:Hypothetical protein BN2458_PEG0049 [Helicobacter typhlonius]|uniref:Uncharacterized protein n=1 Tax=Helicobacter typhlonius TaxID=76936 RepID=A0A0S4PRE8_9HELI|nr:Hypothetical protein BN2458_PEG0049 [Helicobacter typhlonius]
MEFAYARLIAFAPIHLKTFLEWVETKFKFLHFIKNRI